MTTLLPRLPPGRSAPPGYAQTGVVSVWPGTGNVRAVLWEKPE